MNDKSNDGCNSSICDKLNTRTIWNISYVDFKVFSTWFIMYVGVVRSHHWSQWEFSLSFMDQFHIVSIIANFNVIAWMKMEDNCILCNLLLWEARLVLSYIVVPSCSKCKFVQKIFALMQNLFPFSEAKQPTKRNSQVGASMSLKLVKPCRWDFYFKKISGNLTLYLPHVIYFF
jgi:hypothetical protein